MASTEFPEAVAYALSCVGLEDLRLNLEVQHKGQQLVAKRLAIACGGTKQIHRDHCRGLSEPPLALASVRGLLDHSFRELSRHH